MGIKGVGKMKKEISTIYTEYEYEELCENQKKLVKSSKVPKLTKSPPKKRGKCPACRGEGVRTSMSNGGIYCYNCPKCAGTGKVLKKKKVAKKKPALK